MKTDVERLEEKNTVLLKIEVPAEVFDKEVDQAYKRIAGQLVIPGFRKGKIPKTIIDSRLGKQAVHEEAIQKAIPHYYVDAVKGADIEPVDKPEIDIVQVEENKPLIFTAKVTVKPEVKLGEYKGIEVEKPSVEPTEDEIKTQIENMKNNFASLEPVEDRPVNEGDFALIDFEGFIGDEPFEGGSSKDYLLEIGSGTFITGFEDQLVGVKKGEAKDIMVTFPEDYGSEELAGKEAKFKVTVKEIKDKKLPDLNDDFAKQVGFDTVGELEADVKNKIAEVKEKYADTELKNRVVDVVTEAAEVDIPEAMVEQELDDMVEDFSSDVQRQGLTLKKYFELTGMTAGDLRKEWRDRAEQRVKNRLVLEAIADAENIEAAQEDVDNEIKKAAEATGRDFEEIKQIFEMKGTIGALKQRIAIGKTIDWLVDAANIKEEAKEATKETKGNSEEKAKSKEKEKEENKNDKGTEE